MGKITKAIQPKHKETLSPWLQQFVDEASTVPLPALPKILATFPTRWPFPRGDLYHWIPLLNRFDDILEFFCATYKLSDGPQTKDFDCEVLIAYKLDANADQAEQRQQRAAKLAELGYGQDGDCALIVSILDFTQMLLDHCGNRSIYASSAYLNNLLNSTDFGVISSTLQVGVELAQRYQASVKRMGVHTRQVHTALLSNHYNIDLDRVQQMAQPFIKTPIVKSTAPVSLSTPTSATKSKDKDKAHALAAKNVAIMYANDLCAIVKANPPDSSGADVRWNGWGDVKVTYYPAPESAAAQAPPALPQPSDRPGASSTPSTPTPLRRSNTATGAGSTPRSGRLATADDSPSSVVKTPTNEHERNSVPGQRVVEIPQSTVVSSSIYQLLERMPEDLPKEAKYDFLNRLRIAKALTGPTETRQQALKVRLLAIQNLAYIHNDNTFLENVLRQDHDEPRRFQLVYQLAELVHPSTDASLQVPIDLQAIALSLLEAIANFHHRMADIFSALNATVNHGVLLYVIRKAVADMKEDDSGDRWTVQDEWRDNLFSLTLNITMSMANSSTRNMPEIISAGLLDVLVEIFKIRSNVAERTYGTLVGFLDSLVHNVQSSLQTLISADGLEAITNLVTHEVDLARKLAVDGKGTPQNHRSQVVDYQIPFYQQQNLKFLLKFIHHLMHNSMMHGGNTDRVLRNLVDKSALLGSIREIIENMHEFGSLVWTNAVTILSDFLNNDPTSFAAISEAGLVQSFLKAVTGRSVAPDQPVLSEPPPPEPENEGNEAPAVSQPSDIIESDTRPHPPTAEMLEAPREGQLAHGILPSADAVTFMPNILSAICLNQQGMKMVLSSGAFDSYFEIFESPEHVRIMAMDPDLAQSMGISFDELARHHPLLRPAISNAAIDMIARVSHLTRVKAESPGWGAKMVGSKSADDSGPDQDVEMADATAQEVERNPDSTSVSESIVPYVSACANFFASYMNNSSLKVNMVQAGGVELLLDILTAPSLPHDFGESHACKTLLGALSSLIDSSPIIGLPSLCRRIQNSLDAVDQFLHSSDSTSFFAAFVSAEAAGGGDEVDGRVAEGTSRVKALLNIQLLFKLLWHCFPYSTRSQSMILYPVNVYDYYERLVKSFGPLLRAATLEDMAVVETLPRHWTAKDSALVKIFPGDENEQLREVLSSAARSPSDIAAQTEPSKEEQASPAYRNSRVLRSVLGALLPSTLPLIQHLGKALLIRRERDQYSRVRHLQLAEGLAQTLIAQFNNLDGEKSVQNYRYWVALLHAVQETLIDRHSSSRPSDRSGSQLIVPVLIAFKKQGGLDILKNLLKTFQDELSKNQTEEEAPLPKLAQIGIKKILDMYSTMVNGKVVVDSVQQVNLLSRHISSADRRAEPQVGPNLLVELRMAILPAVRDIWESNMVEKASAPMLAKTVGILKLISLADSESTAYHRADPTPPPQYLQAKPLRYAWSSTSQETKQLIDAGYSEDLAQEAVYRANMVHTAAKEYCSMHSKGLAGSRHPIPGDDAPVAEGDAPAEAAPPTSAEDEMVLDLPPGLLPGGTGDILGELTEAAALSGDRDTATPSAPLHATETNAAASASTSPAQNAASNSPPEEIVDHRTPCEDLDKERAAFKWNLIDRCLDVIRAHPDSTHEVSELISAVLLRISPESSPSAKQEIGATLIHSLMSFVGEMDPESDPADNKNNARGIAAYAHLLSLLLQERGFFTANVDTLKGYIEELLQFLHLPASPSTEELPPWIPYVLLVFEILLSDDEQPGDIQWKVPESEEDDIQPFSWPSKNLNVAQDSRQSLLNSILEILPRVGKEEGLAVAVLRILVILTRDRTAARTVGDKKNLQRLFVMAKQLSSMGSHRLGESRITSHTLTVLRHVIEDEETIKQIMGTEIRSYLETRPHRGGDAATFLRGMSHAALREPKLFIEVANDTLKLHRWGSAETRHQVVLQNKNDPSRDDVAPAVRATEDLSISDVKPSTEGEDKPMTDATKAAQDAKRPVLENPDGVVHFLLCELMNYREVEDKEPPSKETDKAGDESASSADQTPQPESRSQDAKDKKAKNAFKAEEHPIFIYRCFILHCLSELLQSYTRTKMEFINFKRSAAPLQNNTPIKPRSSVLNYLLADLLCSNHLDTSTDSPSSRKKYATALQAQSLLVALVSKTGEKPTDRTRDRFDYEDEPDLLFVRKFVLDTVLKAYKDASSSAEPFEQRYAKMLALTEVMNLMMGDKDKESPMPQRAPSESPERSQAQIRRLMYEKGYLGALTTSIADIDLAYPPVKRTIKCTLRVLRILTNTAIHLSHSNILPTATSQETVEDEIASASSLSEMEEDREETPDLYRNSALGMLEPGRDREEDWSEDSEDDDEEMYDDEYDDEMDYDEGHLSEDREEDVSEDDEDDDIDGMGPIEGLPGDLGVVEVTMDDDDDEDDDDDDDMDEDDGDSDEEEELDSDEMEDRIEIVDDEGNPLEDDGASGWESDSDEAGEDGEEEIDYEAEVQDADEDHVHGLDDVMDGPDERFDTIMRAIEDINDAEERGEGRFLEGEDDDDEEDEEDMMDEYDEYAYEEEYPNEAPPPNIAAPSLGWDTLVVDEGGFLSAGGNPHRHRQGVRSPFPMELASARPHAHGLPRGLHRFGDPRGMIRGGHRHDHRAANNEDGINPLLRRNNDASTAGPPRPPNPENLVRLGLPSGLMGDVDNPMSFINNLITQLPALGGRHGHALHLSIYQGPNGDVREVALPYPEMPGRPRMDRGRDQFQEPSQATQFSVEPTKDRWLEEAKMLFGSQQHECVNRLVPALLAHLIPPAIRAEKMLRAEEEARQQKHQEELKKFEEQNRINEAKAAEEKAAREKAEAEERERAAAEAAVQSEVTAPEASQEDEDDDGTEADAMEGVENRDEASTQEDTSASSAQPRAFTTIRGDQVDITELGIDADYLEALPEEFREEVIAQTISTRRAEAREAPGTGETTEVFQEFLDALPDDLRHEIVQQERAEQRRRDREEARRQAAPPGQSVEAQDMDTASILMTFPPALREQVLMDQGADIMHSLPPEMAAQARRLVRTTNPIAHHERAPSGSGRPREAAPPAAEPEADHKIQRKTVVQMLDKAGVATLLRLMFINVKGGSLESSLRHVLKDVCENRQNRVEIISTFLQILQDGTLDLDAVERSFAQLSIKARQPKEAQKDPKTPQSLKRSLTSVGPSTHVSTSSETSPLMIVQQCLDFLGYLAEANVHVPSLFLTEHDVVSTAMKRTFSRKGKAKDSKANKYAINSLLALLDRDLVMESSTIMESLSQLLSRVTFPLLALDRKQKEANEAIRRLEAEATKTEGPAKTNEQPGEGGSADRDASREPGSQTEQNVERAAENPVASQEAQSSGEAPAAPASADAEATDEAAKLQEKKNAILKKVKHLHPPVIPTQNLNLIINIFVARECSSRTFKETLSTIKNLSAIPGAMMTFGHELARQAQVLSEKIVNHLDDLLPHIEKASSGTEIQGVALAKFSPGASDQNKLLRVLTALDHLFAQKRSDASQGSDEDQAKKQDLINTLYRNATFNALWEKLSACLKAIRQRESLLNVATILLPLIEALMVVCKDTAQAQSQNSQAQEGKEIPLSSPEPESQIAGLFFSFTEEHRRILNELVRNNPSLMKGTFSHLVKNPKVLEFDNKRNWFNRSVHNRNQQAPGRGFPTLQLQVRREHVFHDSFKSLYFKSGDEMKFGKLSIKFHGEEGVDAGGVTREWFQVLARQMFDPNYALFVPVSSDRTTFHPNKLSGVNDEHLMFFKFIGRIIGKALYEGRLLDCFFSRAVYKRILGKQVSVKDMESFDPDYYKSLVWMLENDITDIITETFSVEDDEFGVTRIEDLCENGRDIPVTEENKGDYVRLVVEHKLLSSVKEQMEHFLKGFHEIIPSELVSIFNEQELELLISGLPDIDIDEWKSNTEYSNYTPSSPQIQWFWRAVRSFDKEELAKLLQFVTGTSKVPLNGFKELEGMNGINRFNIHRDYGNKDRLPSSHTCFNQLDLPEYESYDALRRQLLKAITAGSEYFGFA